MSISMLHIKRPDRLTHHKCMCLAINRAQVQMLHDLQFDITAQSWFYLASTFQIKRCCTGHLCNDIIQPPYDQPVPLTPRVPPPTSQPPAGNFSVRCICTICVLCTSTSCATAYEMAFRLEALGTRNYSKQLLPSVVGWLWKKWCSLLLYGFLQHLCCTSIDTCCGDETDDCCHWDDSSHPWHGR